MPLPPPVHSPSRWFGAIAIVGAVVMALSACSDSSPAAQPVPSTTASDTPGSAPSSTTTTPAPAVVPENPAFMYQKIDAGTDLSKLGHVTMVVAARQNGPDAVRAIHAIGAKAYRYVQTYWFPPGVVYDGLDIAAHPDWAFCLTGTTPVAGRRQAGTKDLTFLDMNEQAVHDFFAVQFFKLKAEGWDGVFFDRGYASLTGLDTSRAGIWNKSSSCTESPIQTGATFADAYIGMMLEVRKAGLELMFNYGVSPFDQRTPLRPDPHALACNDPGAAACPRLSDAWAIANWVLDEGVAHPRDIDFLRDFASNRANEKDPAHGGHVIGLITNSAVAGDASRESVFFTWSRVKLFAFGIGVGTGDDGCPGAAAGAVCNRRMVFPELANTTLGIPIDPEPVASNCDEPNSVHCVWTRHYAFGAVVVNAKDHPTDGVVVATATPKCHEVTDVYSQNSLTHGACVTSVTIDLPPWSGRPLRYTR